MGADSCDGREGFRLPLTSSLLVGGTAETFELDINNIGFSVATLIDHLRGHLPGLPSITFELSDADQRIHGRRLLAITARQAATEMAATGTPHPTSPE
jgi:hypothetical protein